MQRRSVCVDVLETPVLHSLPWDRLDLITVVFFSTFRQTFGERQNHNNRKKKFLFLLSHLLSIPAYSSYGILVFKYRSVWWPPPQGPCPLPRQHVCLFGATPLFFFPLQAEIFNCMFLQFFLLFHVFTGPHESIVWWPSASKNVISGEMHWWNCMT